MIVDSGCCKLNRKEITDNINRMSFDSTAREKLIIHYSYLVEKYIKCNYPEDAEEIMSVAFIGMLRAIDNYQIRSQTSLSTSVYGYVEYEVKKYLKKEESYKKCYSVGEVGNPIIEYEDKEEFALLRIALDNLSWKYRVIVKLRYGIDCNKRYPIKEIAEKFNITEAKVNKLLKKSLQLLRENLNVQTKEQYNGRSTKSFYSFFDEYLEEQVNDIVNNLPDEMIKILKYIYGNDLHVAQVDRWSKLDDNSKSKFYCLIQNVRDILSDEYGHVKTV